MTQGNPELFHSSLIDFAAMNFTLSNHASTAMQARQIAHEWIARTLLCPQRVESDLDDSSLVHALATIAERGDRVLRVV